MSAPEQSGASGLYPQMDPLTILVGALGGEGGGILTDWLVLAATSEGFPVQSTSIPGVAQRTGATFYYIEIFPVKRTELKGKQPILSLYPFPGQIDLAVFTELLEAGRNMENGYVSPDRTTLLASTHRNYAMLEKTAPGDGRYHGEGILQAAKSMSKKVLLFDLEKTAKACGSKENAVLLGAIAGIELLPIPSAVLQESIRQKGVAVESNLKGFEAGMEVAQKKRKDPESSAVESPHAKSVNRKIPSELQQRMENSFPPVSHPLILEGIVRLLDYQGLAYARKYISRLEMLQCRIQEKEEKKDYALCLEIARQLALWMSYEDVIRVAHLKTCAGRFESIRKELDARSNEPVQVTDFLDPGIDEICSLLPSFLARPVLRLGQKFPRFGKLRIPMQIRTDTVSGFLRIWLIARLKKIRPLTFRYRIEQDLIDAWLGQVVRIMEHDQLLAFEMVKCAELLKGYGETYQQGRQNFDSIFRIFVEPALADRTQGLPSAEELRFAREAALNDPQGKSLETFLNKSPGKITRS
ncbi:MAG: indolepyruvate oxidoreductase subunit beta family protein [SAR324 cluster bacterium]|nr:indolepyruvate oxidoreductase subunit beta family protein [SAR324 cluster bacterium]